MGDQKRERIEPNEGDQRYVRRNDEGEFTEDQAEVGRSLARDNDQQARTKAEPGHGDKGDRNPKPDDK